MYNIIEVLDKTTLWPGRNGYNVKVKYENGDEAVIKLEKEIVDLIVHINSLREEGKIKMSDAEIDELWNKIDDMALCAYSNGYDEASSS